MNVQLHVQSRAAGDGRPIRQKAHAVVTGIGADQLPVPDQNTQGAEGGHIIVVPVDAADHVIPLVLQQLGHGTEVAVVAELGAIDQDGLDFLGGGVNQVIFVPEIGPTPVYPVRQGHAPGKFRLSAQDRVPQAGGQGRACEQQGQGQKQGNASARFFHGISFAFSDAPDKPGRFFLKTRGRSFLRPQYRQIFLLNRIESPDRP